MRFTAATAAPKLDPSTKICVMALRSMLASSSSMNVALTPST